MAKFEDHDKIVRLVTTANAVEAHILEQALLAEGIPCQVTGDLLDAGIGDIPGLSAEVWVREADQARAEEILRQHRDRSDAPDEESET
jgi:hypothetical protein